MNRLTTYGLLSSTILLITVTMTSAWPMQEAGPPFVNFQRIALG